MKKWILNKWNDPVWSKVIASVIAGCLGLLWLIIAVPLWHRYFPSSPIPSPPIESREATPTSDFVKKPPQPGATRILVADTDAECKIEQKASMKHRIRRELNEEAERVGVPLEVSLTSAFVTRSSLNQRLFLVAP